ncbi:MAG: linear amide C-N hydrolase [Bacteroidales bacterium]|nr:linear amide C-N hydrolase [Bacteroidales bacterium]
MLVILVLTGIKFGPFLKGASSVQKLDEGLYYMEYRGDDGLEDLIEQGGGRSSGELIPYVIQFLSKGFYNPAAGEAQPATFGCSALTARTPEGSVLMGRNFDFNSAVGLITHVIPQEGYETITTFNVEFFGFGDNWTPEGMPNQYMALSSMFFALDGINEKGLAIADLMAGDSVETHQETGKPALTGSAAITYTLRRAANVEEAISVLKSIDMHSDIGAAHHFAISDASGKSVVVEYVDNEMVVVESPAVANHYLCDAKKNVGLMEWDHRYDQLCARLDANQGVMGVQTFEEAIFSVSQPEQPDFLGTAWTTVMDLTHRTVTYYSRRHYDKPFQFILKK